MSDTQRAVTARKALARGHEKAATFSRADLMKAISAELPPSSRHLAPDALTGLIQELADEAIAGRYEPVVAMEAPEWPAPPEYLRRASDGRSVYTRPGTDRYATRVQLSMEEALLDAAQRQAAPYLAREQAARLLGADADTLDGVLREAAHAARKDDTQVRGLRLDQAATAYHLLTSPRTAEILVGPAGSGKTRTMAAVAKAAMSAGRTVMGLATSQAGTNALADAGVPRTLNTSQFLGHTEQGRGTRGIHHLEPGTVLLLDEASMTSTPDLRDITVHAAAHGHKLIICGDHAQLSAVESGGGMNLLVSKLGHVELTEAVRFSQEWEQDASLRLREGQAEVLAQYDDQGRIRGNAPDQAMEDARRLYVARYVQGRRVELIVHSNALGHELARRIRDDLQHLGMVSDGPEIEMADGARASAGDVIIARTNDHPTGVANGDVLRVEAVGEDGTITARKALESTSGWRWAEDSFTYAGYATADLAYGATGHTKQGKTVADGIVLATGTEPANWLYPALTRGAGTNIVCVFTRPNPDTAEQSAATRPAPELARQDMLDAERAGRPLPPVPADRAANARDALAVLADILDRPDEELSATAMRERNLAHADHLGMLNAIWQEETAGLSADRYRQAVREALPADWATAPLESGQATWLWRTLREAEAAGLDPADVARQAIQASPLTGTRDLPSVINARIRKAHPAMIPATWQPWSDQVPEAADPDQQDYLTRLAAAMDARKDRIGEHAAEARPPWAIETAGPVPDDPAQRQEWQRRVSHVAAYRELYGWDNDTEPVGPEPTGDTPEKRAAWHAAFGAMTRTEGIDLRDRSDGSLHLMRASYTTETEWAPPHVAEELRAVRTARTTQAAEAARSDALAATCRASGDHEAADRHEHLAASYRALDPILARVERMDAEIMAHRDEWTRTTEGPRHVGVLADAELRRRHPDHQLPPLRSAEPETPEPFLPEVADEATLAEVAAREEESRQMLARHRERIQDRQNVKVPAREPDYEPGGLAWPSPWAEWNRDAVLKPPPPELRPAPEVERLAADRQAKPHEAGQ